MTQSNHEEVDLVYVIKKVKELVKRWIVLLFKAIDFSIKYWWALIILILLGIGLGYYAQENADQAKNARMIVKLNFDSTDYVYNTVDMLNAKVRDLDSTFFVDNDFKKYWLLKDVAIQPVRRLQDVVNNYEPNNRNIDFVFSNLEFEEENDVNSFVASNFKYHELTVKLKSSAKKDQVERVIAYMNKNALIQEMKSSALSNIKEKLERNRRTLDQIDKIMETYIVKDAAVLSDNQVYIDQGLNFDRILLAKADIQKENDVLTEELVTSSEAVVMLGDVSITNVEKGLLDMKMVVYPILFVFLFLFFAWCIYVFKYLRGVANENE